MKRVAHLTLFPFSHTPLVFVTPPPPSVPGAAPSLTKPEESVELISQESLIVSSGEHPRDVDLGSPTHLTPGRDLLQPPTWRSHINTGKDILDDVRT